MGKIRLNNGQELTIIADGIQASDGNLFVGLVPEGLTISDYDKIFGQEANTQVITVVDYNGNDFKRHTGYIDLRRIEKAYNAVVDYTEDMDGNKIPVTGTAINVYLARLEASSDEYIQAAKILLGEAE